MLGIPGHRMGYKGVPRAASPACQGFPQADRYKVGVPVFAASPHASRDLTEWDIVSPSLAASPHARLLGQGYSESCPAASPNARTPLLHRG
ncbi:hypothetical protein AVEN_42069-1 [Araneus ventricosus]|uniref:Uncharacterized protein n=1 Tax=Araneus ventricosus TaxID=182803 RepID=A0A4Y2W475_ARAVE|nr:hypothetical protein AVEN_42069-1 [Araneus ventricosus]